MLDDARPEQTVITRAQKDVVYYLEVPNLQAERAELETELRVATASLLFLCGRALPALRVERDRESQLLQDRHGPGQSDQRWRCC